MLQQLLNDPVLLAFGSAPTPEEAALGGERRFSVLRSGHAGLPENVHLLTYQPLTEDTMLLRLAHLFQAFLCVLTCLRWCKQPDACLDPETLNSSLRSCTPLRQVGEDAGNLTESAKVDLNSLFKDVQFSGARELQLSAAKPMSEARSASIYSRCLSLKSDRAVIQSCSNSK